LKMLYRLVSGVGPNGRRITPPSMEDLLKRWLFL
jgi:hypothetical protein